MEYSMNLVAKDVLVDSGTIMICDKSFYNRFSNPIFEERLTTIKKVKPGKYKLNWRINGPINGEGVLDVITGEVVICDPCYPANHNHDEWMKLLNSTEYLKKSPIGTVVMDSMGGDGSYNVHFSIIKI